MTEAIAVRVAGAPSAAREIRVHLAELMARRGVGVGELAEQVGIHPNNLTRIKNGHVDGMRWRTLRGICEALQCQPGDLLTYE
ncbi:helix-turn-helix domain-containing protein [Streptomyces andamanensis]|uniref:Helix-turn-helix domain-containing protein n=1 Tax=Streptomyces andamanensis TaxID=1565035 RepID=A0ABV8TCF5_9ACTN